MCECCRHEAGHDGVRSEQIEHHQLSHALLLPVLCRYMLAMVFFLLAALLALMTVLAFANAGRSKNAVANDNGALAIYKDQLAELERDQAQGLVLAGEAVSQKTEIARRMLQAAREVKSNTPSYTRTLPWYLALAVPVVAGLIYWQLGSPQAGDAPRAARLASALANNDRIAQVAMVEDVLDRNPDDAKGWQVLLVEYQSTGRYADAARALTNVMRIKGETGAGYADLAELLTAANNGLVTSESASAAREALAREPGNPKAMLYAGLALKQEGNTAAALALFGAMAAASPADAPWASAVKDEIAELQKTTPAPASSAPEIAVEQIEEGMGMALEERQKMIAGMVDGLEQRLAQNGNDLQGWLRLIRARAVLGEREKAATALASARKVFIADAAATAALAGLAKEADLQ